MNQVFEIGDKIEITRFNKKGSESHYGSQVLDFDGIRTLKIATPVESGHLVPLSVDEDCGICFFTKSGLYQCKIRIKDRYMVKKIGIMDALIVSEPEKFQRRKFFRLECNFGIQYRRFSAEEVRLRELLAADHFPNEKMKKECSDQLFEMIENWKDAIITDLSGGGIRFYLSERLEVGEPIELEIPLSLKAGIVPLRSFAHVISSEGRGGSAADFAARCEFDELTARQREQIVKFVFEEQRRRMSGGEK